jgi:hypothetical protein
MVALKVFGVVMIPKDVKNALTQFLNVLNALLQRNALLVTQVLNTKKPQISVFTNALKVVQNVAKTKDALNVNKGML